MQISELGEFALIDRLTKDVKLHHGSTVKGIGDDCAIVDTTQSAGRALLTSDLLLEGIHFDLVYTPMQHLGYKAAMVNISDVYAMGGTPRQMLVSVAVDRRITVEALDDFYAGLRLACERHHVDIVGGDTSSTLTGMVISITVMGDAPADEVVCRSGAKDTDLVCVSGNLGAAYLGLQLLEREKGIYFDQLRQQPQGTQLPFEPDFAGKEYLLERILKPEARRDVIENLKKAGIHPTSMIDISDGLSSELLHICKASGCGCRIFEERIPIDYQTASTAEEFNMNVYTCALNGGEDYELLFTVPLADHQRIAEIEDVKVIGHITRQDLGTLLVTRDGGEFELKAQGWQHNS